MNNLRTKSGLFRITNSINDNFLNNIKQIQAWFLGLMAADGCVSKKNQFSISQSGDCGKDLIYYLKDILNFNGPIYETVTMSGKISYGLFATSERLVARMKEFGIVNNKSLKYDYPNISNKMNKSFIRGYFEGDGSIGIYKVGNTKKYLIISFVGKNEFCEKVSEISPVKPKIRLHSCGTVWEARWSGKKAIDFGRWLYSETNLFEGKKYNIFKEYENTYKKRFEEYIPIRKEVLKLLDKGVSPMLIAKKFNLPFQTIYKWRQSAAKRT